MPRKRRQHLRKYQCSGLAGVFGPFSAVVACPRPSKAIPQPGTDLAGLFWLRTQGLCEHWWNQEWALFPLSGSIPNVLPLALFMSVNREQSQTALGLSSAAQPSSELLYLFSSSPKTPPAQQQLEVRAVGSITGRLWQMLNEWRRSPVCLLFFRLSSPSSLSYSCIPIPIRLVPRAFPFLFSGHAPATQDLSHDEGFIYLMSLAFLPLCHALAGVGAEPS